MPAPDSYRTIAGPTEGSYRDRGSRFLAFAFPVSSTERVHAILGNLKKKYHDARHHCYAYRLGAAKRDYRAFDDGEPSHSAGKPILGQIESHDLSNVLVVVVRYFGGTLLGVGGLMRAYRAAAADALRKASIILEFETELIEIRYPYSRTGDIMKLIQEEKAVIQNQDYTGACRLEVRVRKNRASKMLERIRKFPDAEAERKNTPGSE